MKLLGVLILASHTVYVHAKAVSCYTNRGENLIQFNTKNQDLMIPCKYNALKAQQCGKWKITLSPGNIWMYPKYQLDTLHMFFENDKGDFWEGRITNKLAVHWLANPKGEPVATRDGNIKKLKKFFRFKKDKKATVTIADKKNEFKISFTPWDPSARAKFPNSEWRFDCNVDGVKLNPFPDQMCGNETRNVVEDIAKQQFGLGTNFQNLALLFATFTNPEIAHTDPMCSAATDVMVKKCSNDQQRMNVIKNCQPILGIKNHAECISAGEACTPMETFLACVKWGCTDFSRKEKDLCYDVATQIDMCAVISNGGNLTARVYDANCYADFLAVSTGDAIISVD